MSRAQRLFPVLCLLVGCKASTAAVQPAAAELPPGTEIVSFASGSLTLGGLLLRPRGNGPFPAILYNHGSAPAKANDLAFAAIAPVFAARGWIFFMPYRRGQGLSAAAGRYIGDEIADARRSGGLEAAAATQLRLLAGDHLDDQLAALAWLARARDVQRGRIAVAGNSFGGIESVLAAERGGICAAVDASGGAESWTESPPLRERMTTAVRNARAPIFFFQAENDFDLAPTRVLHAAMVDAGKKAEMKIYPPFGTGAREGHSFAYRGVSVWADDVLGFLARSCPPTP